MKFVLFIIIILAVNCNARYSGSAYNNDNNDNINRNSLKKHHGPSEELPSKNTYVQPREEYEANREIIYKKYQPAYIRSKYVRPVNHNKSKSVYQSSGSYPNRHKHRTHRKKYKSTNYRPHNNRQSYSMHEKKKTYNNNNRYSKSNNGYSSSNHRNTAYSNGSPNSNKEYIEPKANGDYKKQNNYNRD